MEKYFALRTFTKWKRVLASRTFPITFIFILNVSYLFEFFFLHECFLFIWIIFKQLSGLFDGQEFLSSEHRLIAKRNFMFGLILSESQKIVLILKPCVVFVLFKTNYKTIKHKTEMRKEKTCSLLHELYFADLRMLSQWKAILKHKINLIFLHSTFGPVNFWFHFKWKFCAFLCEKAFLLMTRESECMQKIKFVGLWGSFHNDCHKMDTNLQKQPHGMLFLWTSVSIKMKEKLGNKPNLPNWLLIHGYKGDGKEACVWLFGGGCCCCWGWPWWRGGCWCIMFCGGCCTGGGPEFVYIPIVLWGFWWPTCWML